METTTTFIVQAWTRGYDYWSNCAEPAESTFALPNPYHETEAEGREHLGRLRAANPKGRYRLVRQVTTTEEI